MYTIEVWAACGETRKENLIGELDCARSSSVNELSIRETGDYALHRPMLLQKHRKSSQWRLWLLCSSQK